MSDTSTSTKAPTGQEIVEIFCTATKQYLQYVPGRRIRGSRRSIVETVINHAAPQLKTVNKDHLAMQLSMAFSATHRNELGVRYVPTSSGCEVSLV